MTPNSEVGIPAFVSERDRRRCWEANAPLKLVPVGLTGPSTPPRQECSMYLLLDASVKERSRVRDRNDASIEPSPDGQTQSYDCTFRQCANA